MSVILLQTKYDFAKKEKATTNAVTLFVVFGNSFFSEFRVADFVGGTVDVESGSGEILESNSIGSGIDLEIDFSLFFAVAGGKCSGNLKQGIVFESEDSILTIID